MYYVLRTVTNTKANLISTLFSLTSANPQLNAFAGITLLVVVTNEYTQFSPPPPHLRSTRDGHMLHR
jgi:hypothetical protein